MREWAAALDAICARINPVLVLVAIVITLLNLAVAAQQWTVVHPASSLPVRTVVVTVPSERCFPTLAPELRDLVGYD